MKFTLIGFGEVGSLVGALINNSFENIQINILNTQSTKSGRILDLEHAAAIQNNTITHNSQLEHEDADVIIFSAGYSNAHGESRNSVAAKNKQLVHTLFDSIRYNKKPVIIVITNPVEPISYWIHQKVGNQAKVIGTGTSLDTFRLEYILSRRFNCKPREVECLVIGEHGQNMVPIFSMTTIKGSKIAELCSQEVLDEITDELIHSAFQIRETEKATKYGIAETTLFLVKAIISEKSCEVCASYSELGSWNKEFNFTIPIFISLPYQINSKEIIPLDIELTSKEKEAFQKAIDAISEQII